MARPRRDDADYFRHDTDSRDPKQGTKSSSVWLDMYWNLIEHIGHSTTRN